MSEYQLTPAEKQRLARKSRLWFRAAAAIAGASLTLFAVAVWTTDWRYAGIAAIALVPAAFLAFMSVEADKPSAQQRLARRLRQREEPTP